MLLDWWGCFFRGWTTTGSAPGLLRLCPHSLLPSAVPLLRFPHRRAGTVLRDGWTIREIRGLCGERDSGTTNNCMGAFVGLPRNSFFCHLVDVVGMSCCFCVCWRCSYTWRFVLEWVTCLQNRSEPITLFFFLLRQETCILTFQINEHPLGAVCISLRFVHHGAPARLCRERERTSQKTTITLEESQGHA